MYVRGRSLRWAAVRTRAAHDERKKVWRWRDGALKFGILGERSKMDGIVEVTYKKDDDVWKRWEVFPQEMDGLRASGTK